MIAHLHSLLVRFIGHDHRLKCKVIGGKILLMRAFLIYVGQRVVWTRGTCLYFHVELTYVLVQWLGDVKHIQCLKTLCH